MRSSCPRYQVMPWDHPKAAPLPVLSPTATTSTLSSPDIVISHFSGYNRGSTGASGVEIMSSEATKRQRRRNPSGGVSPARKDTLMRRLEENAGREKIIDALEWSGDARGQALLDLMTDPAYRKHTFAGLCGKVGLRYHEARTSSDASSWTVQ